ncbi:MAG: hypothetical protein HZB23_15500 [Deltaproteobacteria bacterium]|nr:hypothetical protein [Deltaproteobacteria bacterium]
MNATSSRACNFLIDVQRHELYCTKCHGECDKLALPAFDLFWCPNLLCENIDEVRYYGKHDKWRFLAPGRVIQENLLQQAMHHILKNSLLPEAVPVEE